MSLGFSGSPLNYLRHGGYVFTSVCLSVRLSVCLLTELIKKLISKSLCILMEWLDIFQGPIGYILTALDPRGQGQGHYRSTGNPRSRSLKIKRSQSLFSNNSVENGRR